MKKILIFYFSMLATVLQAQKSNLVFKSGENQYHTFRIPAIVRAGNGSLLAFAEGRKNNTSDFGNIDIVLKRSEDGGKTWSGFSIVAENGNLQAGNPAPVIDMLDPDYPHGRIFLFYNTGNASEHENRLGKGVREVWYKTSEDFGETWSVPVNITLQVHKPNNRKFNKLYRFEEDWRSYANTPGHAVQLKMGKYKGRLFVAANHSEGNPQQNFKDYFSHGFYSDDHGKTFHLSESVSFPGSNEAMAVETSDDKLMMNIRNQQGNRRQRLIAESSDGGETWDKVYFDKNLPDPVCQGSILGFERDGKTILFFCNNADSLKRDHLTLRVSEDSGKFWNGKEYYIDGSKAMEGKEFSSFTAYSDIVYLGERRIGVLYERKDYAEIVFKVIEI